MHQEAIRQNKLHGQWMCGRSNTHDARANQRQKKENFHSTMQDITFMNCVWKNSWLSHFVAKARRRSKSPTTCHHNCITLCYGLMWTLHMFLVFILVLYICINICIYIYMHTYIFIFFCSSCYVIKICLYIHVCLHVLLCSLHVVTCSMHFVLLQKFLFSWVLNTRLKCSKWQFYLLNIKLLIQ